MNFIRSLFSKQDEDGLYYKFSYQTLDDFIDGNTSEGERIYIPRLNLIICIDGYRNEISSFFPVEPPVLKCEKKVKVPYVFCTRMLNLANITKHRREDIETALQICKK